VEGQQLVVQQVFAFGSWLVGRDDGQALALDLPDGYRRAGDELFGTQLFGRGGVTERLQQAGLHLDEGVPALVGFVRALDLAAQREPALGPGLQPLGRRAVGVIACVLSLGGVPSVQALLDVVLEDLSEVVVAVELVLVGDAGEGLDGFQDRHGQAPAACGWQTPAST